MSNLSTKIPHNQIYKKMKRKLLTGLIALLLAITPVLCNDHKVKGHDNETGVREAYELRISGKADEALTLLNDLLKGDSTNAKAYVELARTKQHLMLGGKEIAMDELVNAWQNAVKYAPENETYAFYYAVASLMNAYVSLMKQQQDAAKTVTQACDMFEKVLKLNPDCYEALLYLVDLYGMLPEDLGGNREKAEIYAEKLNKKDRICGAIAYSRLLPDTADQVLYWQEVMKETGANAQVLEELGRAYLFKSDTENGTKYYQAAIRSDPARKYLYMHLVRYHILSCRQNPDEKEKHLEAAEKLANIYLQSDPELTRPLKAYTYQILALIQNIAGNQSGVEEFINKAKELDPFYSHAMGKPSPMLHCPQNEIKIVYDSFFLPF
jgi:tetratricopeptide (TPR) repeat protein